MSIAKIPFGLNTDSGQYVDVHSVAHGKNCGCVCPSCKVPLIAAQGTKNAWYFRHNSLYFDDIKNECKLSFHVSVRMMAKQIIGENLVIYTPNYLRKIDFSSDTLSHFEPYLITSQKEVHISEIRLDEKFESTTVDVLGKVSDYDFIIYFTYPGRGLPHPLEKPINTKCGVIQISTEGWENIFFHKKNHGNSYSEILADLICNDVKSKSWVFHPKQSKAELDARKKYEDNERLKNIYFQNIGSYSTASETVSNLNSTNASSDIKVHKCMKCNRDWRGYVIRCPNCGETERITSK